MAIMGPTKAKMVPFSVESQQLCGKDNQTWMHNATEQEVWCIATLTKQVLHLHHVLHSNLHVLPVQISQKAGEYLNNAIGINFTTV